LFNSIFSNSFPIPCERIYKNSFRFCLG
jgi:hypothetical protein